MTCRNPDTFLLARTFVASHGFVASFAATSLPFVLRAQVLYHVLIKTAESENEDNIMCLLFPASAHFDLNRKNRI